MGVFTRAFSAKAEIGPGVASFSYPQLMTTLSGRTHPQKIMAEAQALYHQNQWVALAERTVVGRAMQMPYRLEDAEGDTITPKSHPSTREFLQFLTAGAPEQGMSRRALWATTMRHEGLCGIGYWVLDQTEGLYGTPLQVLYVNPARLTCVKVEGRIAGYILDATDSPVTHKLVGTTPIPLRREEVLRFVYEHDDWDEYGIGIAEAAAANVQLNRLSTRHATSVVGLGGRLAGIVSPETAMDKSSDEWKSMVSDWRNLSADPDSAKRLQIVRVPIEFTQTAADPTELQLIELMGQSRDDILNAWGVPPSQAGIRSAAGLNSGESRDQEQEVLIRGPVLDRLDAFRDGLQPLIDRWSERVNVDMSLVFDIPSFDDRSPLFEQGKNAEGQPLTNDERRQILGLDPMDDEELGRQILIDQRMVPAPDPNEPEREVPVGLTPFGAPPVAPPAQEEEAGAETGAASGSEQGESPSSEGTQAKATKPRERSERELLPGAIRDTAALFARQLDEVARKVNSRFGSVKSKPKDQTIWWDEARWNRELADLLDPFHAAVAEEGATTAQSRLESIGKAADPLRDVIRIVRRSGLSRVTDINATSRLAIKRVITDGLAAGQGPSEIATAIRGMRGMDRARAEVVARTELMLAYNEASLRTYTKGGVDHVNALDGDQDDACAERVSKNPWPIREAMDQTDHPNGTLDWVPA